LSPKPAYSFSNFICAGISGLASKSQVCLFSGSTRPRHVTFRLRSGLWKRFLQQSFLHPGCGEPPSWMVPRIIKDKFLTGVMESMDEIELLVWRVQAGRRNMEKSNKKICFMMADSIMHSTLEECKKHKGQLR
jgi:hypothetical protein